MSIINKTPLKWTIKLLYHPQNPNQTNPCSYDWLALKAQTNKLDQTGRKTSRIMNAVVGTTIYCSLRWQAIHKVTGDTRAVRSVAPGDHYWPCHLWCGRTSQKPSILYFYLVMRHMLHIALSLFRIWFFINQYVLLL